MLDSENIMGTGTHVLPETHKHNDLNDFSLFDFGVQEEPLFYNFNGEYVQAEKRKAVIRSDTGDFIGNHSKRYKTVPHIDLYKIYTDKLKEDDVSKGNLEIVDSTWDNGAKAKRTIHFLDHKTKVKEGDDVCLRTDIFNSIDGSWAFQTFTGAFRSLCLNTLVFGGQRFYHEYKKHTSGLNVHSAVSKISETLNMYTNHGEKFKKWTTTEISDMDAVRLLANTICKKENKAVSTLADLDKVGYVKAILRSDTGEALNNDLPELDTKLYKQQRYDTKLVNTNLCDYLLHRFNEEKLSNGSTLWGLYNAVTHWSTHTDETFERENSKGKLVEVSMGRKGSQKANVQKEREISVRNMLDSQDWLQLQMVA